MKLNSIDINWDALIEKIKIEALKVVENINDPNTEAKKPRKIVAEIVFTPSENRKMVGISFSCKPAKLVEYNEFETNAIIGEKNGQLIIIEQNSDQLQLDLDRVYDDVSEL